MWPTLIFLCVWVCIAAKSNAQPDHNACVRGWNERGVPENLGGCQCQIRCVNQIGVLVQTTFPSMCRWTASHKKSDADTRAASDRAKENDSTRGK